ncbi:hypothetical protein [Streptomyces goshikiensis]|uniref:hypothetical protein n=1 Tax=Streptomyces goshikiensis TaxID=1942 RepID=UPI00365BDAAD
MEAGDWATWAGAAGAGVAAVASVAVWWKSRSAITWQLCLADQGRSRVINTGTGTARQVHVRVGSASNSNDSENEAQVQVLSPGEPIPILVAPTFGSAEDCAVVVTWRTRFRRRRRRWTYIVH